MNNDTLKRVCSLETKREVWSYDGVILMENWMVSMLGRENKLPIPVWKDEVTNYHGLDK